MANGIVPGLQCSSARTAELYAEHGFKLITVGSDSQMLRRVLTEELTLARGT